MSTYPKVKSVTLLPGKRLRVAFEDGATRVYNSTPLLKEAPFAPLKNEAFFRNVQADRTGYGVVWNDNVDLSESELWIHGEIETSETSDEQ